MVGYHQRVRACAHVWQAAGAPPAVLDIVVHGVKWKWARGVPPPRRDLGEYPCGSREREFWFGGEEKRLSDLGVLHEVDEKECAFISPAFFVPKKHSFRMVADLSTLNTFLLTINVIYPKLLPFLLNWFRDECTGIVLDISDAFYAVGMHPDMWTFLGIRLFGKVYQLRALPMGLCISPAILTQVFAPLCEAVKREFHLNLMMYLDDMLGICYESVELDKVVKRVKEFGLGVKVESLQQGRSLTYLGLLLNLRDGRVELGKKKQGAMRYEASTLIAGAKRKKRLVLRSELERVLGKFVHYATALPLVRTRLGRLYYDLHHAVELRRKEPPKVRLSADAFEALEWIANLELKEYWRSLKIAASDPLVLWYDASSRGWGAVAETPTGDEVVGGRFTLSERGMHITYLECLAAYFAILAFVGKLRPKMHLKVLGDNAAVVAALTKKITTSVLYGPLCKVHDLLHERGVTAEFLWVSTLVNKADKPSRGGVPEDYKFLKFELVLKYFGTTSASVHTDIFARRSNAQVERYFSDVKEEGSAGEAWTESWEDPEAGKSRYAWINPPFSQLRRVVRRILEERVKCFLTLPLWAWLQQEHRLLEVFPMWEQEATDTSPMYARHGTEPVPAPSWTTRIYNVSW